MRSRGSAWLVFALAAAVLGIAIALEAWPWISDDAFISMRYSERFLEGKGLTWNDGEYVEGYSNLSWVLLTALLGAFGMDLLDAVRVLGIAATLLAAAVLAFGFTRTLPWPAKLATVLLVAQPTAVLWAIGGLEAPLVMACIGFGLYAVWRGIGDADAASARRWFARAGAAYAVLVLTRPDAPLWCAAAVLVMTLVRPASAPTWRMLLPVLLLVAAPGTVTWFAQTGFRTWYFGDWVANTTRAKLAPSLAGYTTGLDYLRSAAESLRSLWLPALGGAVLAWRTRALRPLCLYTLAVVPLWCVYIGALGGDYFPRNRVMVPLLVPLAMLAAVAFARLAAVRPWVGWAGVLLAVGLARFDGAWLPSQPVPPPRLMRQTLSHWEWRGVFCGEWLRDAFGAQQPLLALDQVGALPYASKLPCVDMLGLCDRTIATTPIEPSRLHLTGHARGNGRYVLSRRPDLIGFLPPPHSPTPSYASGTQMEGDPAFLDGYRLVQFDVDRFDATRCGLEPGAPMILHTWLRLRGKLGHGDLEGDRVVVPAYLLGSYRQPYAFGLAMTPKNPGEPGYEQWAQDVGEGWAFIQARRVLGVLDRANGRVDAHLRVHGDHVLRGLALPAGHWRLAGPTLPAGVTVQLTANGQPLAAKDRAWHVAAANGTTPRVDVVCTVAPTVALPLVLHELVFERAR